MISERNLIALICALLFLGIAFTPIIPLMYDAYGVTNIYVIKATIGITTLACSWGFIWALFKKSDERKIKREGKIHFRPMFILVGALLICVAWFTDVPLWLSDSLGLSIYSFNDTMTGGVGHRIFVSCFTALGVLLIKFSTFRATPGFNRPVVDETKFNNMLDDSRGGGIQW